MKKLATVAAALLVGFTSMANNGKTESEGKTYTVNAEKSVMQWTGKKVTGEHRGKISVKQGEITLNGTSIEGTVWADMTSITCEDLEGEWNDKLVGHLKSDDFFSVENNPTAEFVFTSYENGTVNGKLTIKGITNDVSFPAELVSGKKTLALKGTLTFDRTLYEIKYGSGKFFEGLGDKMIYDEVQLDFTLIANK